MKFLLIRVRDFKREPYVTHAEHLLLILTPIRFPPY